MSIINRVKESLCRAYDYIIEWYYNHFMRDEVENEDYYDWRK